MAGLFGFFDYAKAGKGVGKDEYEPRIKIFFDVFFRKFWKFIQLNLIYCICCLPLVAVALLFLPINNGNDEKYIVDLLLYSVGILLYLSVIGLGFFAPGFTYILRNFSRQTHAWILSDFFEHIKKNFKQSFLMFIIDTAVLYLFYINMNFYSQTSNNFMFIAKYVIIIAAVIYFMMHFYIYQIMVTFKMPLKQIIKNSFIITLAHLPRNLMVLIIVVIVAVLTFSISVSIGIFISVLISVSLIGYIINFMAEPIIARYMLEPLDDEKEIEQDTICSDDVKIDDNDKL